MGWSNAQHHSLLLSMSRASHLASSASALLAVAHKAPEIDSPAQFINTYAGIDSDTEEVAITYAPSNRDTSLTPKLAMT